ncbi:Uncharacterised protein [Mycobacterium tuberculosis]|nr:Uncharacterised protein [Mycobacterium tuberculosis]
MWRVLLQIKSELKRSLQASCQKKKPMKSINCKRLAK